ncbi:hypothetical protein [Halomonas sp. M20]|uniref:hypothetical protein n=1 Tax=Halomonas sp. M20 TaxID=2763264 RepID=UPI001D0A66A0|nr:hypothetical protein [Halomonas sp. M20]
MNSVNDPLATMDPALLQRLGIDDAKLTAAAQLMEQIRAASNEPSVEETEVERSASDTTAALRAEVKRLRRENQLLVYQADTLADALGACHCFGTDPQCPDCQGDGGPGSFIPGRRNFRNFVIPVLEALRDLRNARAARKAATSEETTASDQAD